MYVYAYVFEESSPSRFALSVHFSRPFAHSPQPASAACNIACVMQLIIVETVMYNDLFIINVAYLAQPRLVSLTVHIFYLEQKCDV